MIVGILASQLNTYIKNMNLLILYPKEFNCFSKFVRKITNIICKKSVERVLYPSDENRFICDFFKEHISSPELLKKKDWIDYNITHAIIFDDGEEFIEETQKIKNLKIPLRFINIAITRVVNIKKETQYKNIKSTPEYEYIGRGSYWGNPYSMFEDGDDRDEVIRKYKYDFDHEMFPNKEKLQVYKLTGKRLGCFCKPQSCHGDILADYLNSYDDGK
ncbi:hypothetical protein MNBD_GAMMA26-1074 [hydrothermal vent metagenome]|uniref:DUF4326 domain-containing protein n=1 Tax=hydrothermal vent metagenome TaxID=652676 RepID=A0A3B1BEH2_9ZZZZ